MHVMTSYLDTRKAAVSALLDYPAMEALAETDATEQEAQRLRTDLTSPSSPRIDGMPRAKDPHAGEQRIVNTLDKIDLLAERKRQALEYLDWFLPAWAILSEDDRYILETFYLGENSQEWKVNEIADHFNIERDSVYRKKNRAVDRLATALYGRC